MEKNHERCPTFDPHSFLFSLKREMRNSSELDYFSYDSMDDPAQRHLISFRN